MSAAPASAGGGHSSSGRRSASPRRSASSRSPHEAAYGPTLALTTTLALAAFITLMSSVLLVVHPANGLGVLSPQVILQKQSAKTALYLAAFLVILPLALIVGPRLADTLAARPNASALPAIAGTLAGTLAGVLVAVKLSASLPWGDGLGVVLVAVGGWWVMALAILAAAARTTRHGGLSRLEGFGSPVFVIAGLLLLGTLVCVTNLHSISVLGLGTGALAAVAAGVLYIRIRLPRLAGWRGAGIDILMLVILILAIPDTVIFHPSPVAPNIYTEPGVIQFQQDWLLAPANQLLAGGALLVNAPVSQYGVGSIYFLAGWFHLVPIGYGTFGFLDGILTALFYATAYGVLRIAGVTRMLAAAALTLAVAALIYNLHFPVGALPEQGPLRFGLPMLLIFAFAAEARWPRRARIARGLALAVMGVASIWAFEAFAYTAVTFLAMVALEAFVLDRGERRRYLARQLALAAGAFVCAHLILALATLAGTGQLPDWGQYLAYLNALLLGGKEGSLTFGFENWSPGLAVGAVCLGSAAAIALLAARRPEVLARERTTLIALTGMTAYAIAVFSYTDNRSSTYLLPYVTLPILIAVVLWLGLVLRSALAPGVRHGALAFALTTAVLMLGAAWPSIGEHFSNSALAHAYPGGGLKAALDRLWHPPPVDPRAPEGERLLSRYIPGRRVVILLPDAVDLSIEILVRSGKANRLFLGDANQDTFVPSVWMGKVSRGISGLRGGERVLIDQAALTLAARLRADRSIDPLAHPIGSGNPEVEWILKQVDQRFRLGPIHRAADGLLVARLVRR